MKRLFLSLLPLALFVAAVSLHAQTSTTYSITNTGSFHCGYNPAQPYCYGLPITDNSTGAAGQVFLLNGNLTFMGGFEGLGTAVYTSVYLDEVNDVAVYSFKGTKVTGESYTGSLTAPFKFYTCGRWHNETCWEIQPGGTGTITTN